MCGCEVGFGREGGRLIGGLRQEFCAGGRGEVVLLSVGDCFELCFCGIRARSPILRGVWQRYCRCPVFRSDERTGKVFRR